MKLRGVFLCVLIAVLATGCRTAPPLPPADFSAPGWRVQQGQAVWKPSSSRPELAGDLLLATNANGNFFIQFSKIPFPLVTALISAINSRLNSAQTDFRGMDTGFRRTGFERLTGGVVAIHSGWKP